MGQTYSPHINILRNIVRIAGKGLIRDFIELDILQNSKRGTLNFATKARERIERSIITEIKRFKENALIVSGENANIISGDDNSDYRFTIIAIDGFINFMHSIPLFSTAIAIEKKNIQGEYESVSAIVDVAVQRECYYTEKGNGVIREVYSEANTTSRKLKVSERKTPEEMLVCSENRFKENYNYFSTKSQTLDLIYFASGKFDIIDISNTSKAFKILATEAGGVERGNIIYNSFTHQSI